MKEDTTRWIAYVVTTYTARRFLAKLLLSLLFVAMAGPYVLNTVRALTAWVEELFATRAHYTIVSEDDVHESQERQVM